MADDKKLSELTELSVTPADTDQLYINDGGVSKRITYGTLKAGLDTATTTHAATEKATPVDADEVPLADSAASFVLKRLTWANIKTTLSGVFALLAGKAGGQTLIGGTAVTDKLVLQGTSGNGTSTATALEVNVGNNGATNALTVLNNGNIYATARNGLIWGIQGFDAGMTVNFYYGGDALNAITTAWGGSSIVKCYHGIIFSCWAGETAKIGISSASIDSYFNGKISIGTTNAPIATVHPISTTEQLRLGYDASNYASFTVDSAGNLTLTNTGTTPSTYIATLRSGVKVTAVTTTASPAATDAGTVFNNIGDANGATITLPTAAAGLQFTACVMVAQTLTITAGSGDNIRIAGSATAAAGSITSATIGNSITLVAQDSETWMATSVVGTWTI